MASWAFIPDEVLKHDSMCLAHTAFNGRVSCFKGVAAAVLSASHC